MNLSEFCKIFYYYDKLIVLAFLAGLEDLRFLGLHCKGISMPNASNTSRWGLSISEMSRSLLGRSMDRMGVRDSMRSFLVG